jgi:hypothetical protein
MAPTRVRQILFPGMVLVAGGLLWACCRTPEPSRPSAEELTGKPADQQCKMIASRIRPCINELVAENARTTRGTKDLSSKKLGDVLQKEFDRKDREAPVPPHVAAREAVQICKIECLVDPDFVFRVLHCWDQKKCADFAACLYRSAQ